jgi:hypothetical protein
LINFYNNWKIIENTFVYFKDVSREIKDLNDLFNFIFKKQYWYSVSLKYSELKDLSPHYIEEFHISDIDIDTEIYSYYKDDLYELTRYSYISAWVEKEVKDSLVNHDWYPSNIIVKQCK